MCCAWKNGMESKGLHVNLDKTKCIASRVYLDVLCDWSDKFHCAVWRIGIGASPILCGTQAMGSQKCFDQELNHSKGQNISVSPLPQWSWCVPHWWTHFQDGASWWVRWRMLTAKCRCIWGKFSEHVPLLTAHALPLKLKGRLFSSNIRNSMMHANETLPMGSDALYKLCQNDCAMVRWICRVRPSDELDMEELHIKDARSWRPNHPDLIRDGLGMLSVLSAPPAK